MAEAAALEARMPSWWRLGRASGSVLEETVRQIKERTELPVIYFPAARLDFVRMQRRIFHEPSNSRSTSYIVENQVLGAPLVMEVQSRAPAHGLHNSRARGTVCWVGTPG